MAKRVIVVKTALMPRFYQDFHCVMGACKDNCCDDNWRIEFNKKDYLTVKRAVQEAGLEEELPQAADLHHRGAGAVAVTGLRGGPGPALGPD